MVYQSKESDCGKACVRNLLVLNYGDEVYSWTELDGECSDFYEIREELGRFGLTYEPFHVDDLEELEKGRFPLIAQIAVNDVFHFVVVTKMTKKKVCIEDPDFGEYELSMNEFLSVFTGQMLLKSTKGKKPQPIKLKFLKKSEVAIYVILFLLEFFSLFFAFYLMPQQSSSFLTLILMVFSLIVILVQNIVNIQVRKRLNKRILVPYLQLSKNESDAAPLARILDQRIQTASNLVSYSVLALLLLCIFVSNGLMFALSAVIAIFLGVSKTLDKSDENLAKRNCTINEFRFFKSLREDERTNEKHFHLAEKAAGSMMMKKALYGGLEMLLYAALVFAMMYLSGTFSLNYFIFYFAMLMMMSKAANNLSSTFLEDDMMAKDVNSLSVSFPSFLMKGKLPLGYTNMTTDGGVLTDGETEDNPRLSGPDGPEKEP